MAVRIAGHRYQFHPGAMRQLDRGAQSPIMRDLSIRSTRVMARMKQNASGRPGPNVRTDVLRGSITWKTIEDSVGIAAQIGPFDRTIKRGYNYALILEGLFPRGGAPPDGKYPFMERSLDAAK